MILYPLDSPNDASSVDRRTLPVWAAIECRQKQESSNWWLVAQPDHAVLAGDLATQLISADFPSLDPDVIGAIALHDEGWGPFNREPLTRPWSHRSNRTRPLSFVEMQPPDFLQAWRASIKRAEQDSPIGGILVSKHFCRIAQSRNPSPQEMPEHQRMISEFLDQEAERQAELSSRQRRTAEEIELLVDVLQFFDLLSLYLCCGSRQPVAFPQKFCGRAIRVCPERGLFRTEPALFGRGVSLGVRAREYPASSNARAIDIPVLIT